MADVLGLQPTRQYWNYSAYVYSNWLGCVLRQRQATNLPLLVCRDIDHFFECACSRHLSTPLERAAYSFLVSAIRTSMPWVKSTRELDSCMEVCRDIARRLGQAEPLSILDLQAALVLRRILYRLHRQAEEELYPIGN